MRKFKGRKQSGDNPKTMMSSSQISIIFVAKRFPETDTLPVTLLQNSDADVPQHNYRYKNETDWTRSVSVKLKAGSVPAGTPPPVLNVTRALNRDYMFSHKKLSPRFVHRVAIDY